MALPWSSHADQRLRAPLGALDSLGREPVHGLCDRIRAHAVPDAVFGLLAYAFPFCVGIYSAVAVRYANRRIESIADFPERKPDPVFRAARDGRLVEVGATPSGCSRSTRSIARRRFWASSCGPISCWTKPADGQISVYFEAEGRVSGRPRAGRGWRDQRLPDPPRHARRRRRIAINVSSIYLWSRTGSRGTVRVNTGKHILLRFVLRRH